ncbi:MAG TPA: glutathione S-transferase family protein [Burkholderiales bacterium]|nr:glutathione S-transferase family protein [Burkholderiales bacterium]
MQLYYHPASTTSRMVMLFAAEHNIPLDMKVVDIFSGEHQGDAFSKVNPSRLVPVLQDEGLVLTESSAILKYLAEKTGSLAYPKDLKERARVNERMDWFNSQFYRDFGYALVYPQVLSYLGFPDPAAQKALVDRGLERAKSWLKVLDRDLIGAHAYVCGERVTLADHFGAVMVEAGKLVGCTYAAYPNVTRWLDRMRALPSWNKVHEAFYGFAGSLKGKSFVSC